MTRHHAPVRYDIIKDIFDYNVNAFTYCQQSTITISTVKVKFDTEVFLGEEADVVISASKSSFTHMILPSLKAVHVKNRSVGRQNCF